MDPSLYGKTDAQVWARATGMDQVTKIATGTSKPSDPYKDAMRQVYAQAELARRQEERRRAYDDE